MVPWLFVTFAVEHLVTALSSGCNAAYFLQYRSRRRGRRLGAAALSLVSAATFIESLYFGAGALVYGIIGVPHPLEALGALAIRMPVAAGSLFITMLILRHKLGSKGAESED